MSEANTLGFIGLGVMGSRMCANLVRRSQRPVVVFDPVPDPGIPGPSPANLVTVAPAAPAKAPAKE